METHAPPAGTPFSDADIHHFHAQDLYAAKVVVCLMVGIFCVGVVLYSIVAWACAHLRDAVYRFALALTAR